MNLPFANRNVCILGVTSSPIELLEAVIVYLGGNIVNVRNLVYTPDVIVIGSNTDQNSITEIERYVHNFNSEKIFDSFIVYEGKMEDYMPDSLTYGDVIDLVKPNIPWSAFY